MNKVTLSDVKEANSQWFERGNKEFFGDVGYFVLHTGSGDPVLARSTYAWSDMFGGPRRLHYRFNWLDQETLKIKSLDENTFESLDELKEFIKEL